MHENNFFFQAFIYLLAAVVSVPISQRLGLGSIVGYLLAGVTIGPFVLGLVGHERADVMHFAEFGVVMMLFLIGLELNPKHLWNMRSSILGMGSLQLILTTALITFLSYITGLPFKESLAIGLILSQSSTAIVSSTLMEKGLMKTDVGRNCFSILLFQDMTVIPIFAVLPLLAFTQVGTQQSSNMAGLQKGVLILVAVSSIVLVGRFLIYHFFRFIAGTHLRESLTAAALLIVVGIAQAMEYVGLSPALGTFLAGVVLAENEFRHQIESDIEPFKGLLLGLFFISVGASINLPLITSKPWMIAQITINLIAAKFLCLFLIGKFFKVKLSQNIYTSLALAQGGEFIFVLLNFALQNQVISSDVSDPLMVAVAISMLMTPIVLFVYEKFIQPLFATSSDQPHDIIEDNNNNVIIAGYGRFGQIVGRMLIANNIRPTILDSNSDQIELLRKFGHKVFFGNALNLDLLRSAKVDNAKLFIIAIDKKEDSLRLVDLLQKNFPQVKILARAVDRVHAFELMKRDVNLFERELFHSSLQLGIKALIELGVRAHKAHRSAKIFSFYDNNTLKETFPLYFSKDEKTLVTTVRQRNEEIEKVLTKDLQRGSHEMDDEAWDQPK